MSFCDVEYQDASYNGITFEIAPSNSKGKRDIITHRYPFTDYHYNEDLGLNAEEWSVSGFFTGPDFRDKLNLAKRVWRVKGPGVFFEPTQNKNHPVVLKSWDFNYDPKKINYVAFTLTFVEKGDDVYPSLFGGLLGIVNGVVDSLIETVSTTYANVMGVVGAFNDATVPFTAAKSFLRDTSRMTVGEGQVEVNKAISEASLWRSNPQKTVDQVVSSFETAASNDAPVSFFRAASEVRTTGNEAQQAQGLMASGVALAYYFDAISDGASAQEIQAFRERALALKAATADVELKNEIDEVIYKAGLAYIKVERAEAKDRHVLVASYHEFGDVSMAYEMIMASGGVSGSDIEKVYYEL